ncbi:hypothetical protein B0H17DRAFT_1140418 [Mycena rosella]|uniref:Uncharacterized protein n=1 Tax=Mycena rosella TaxID=1033263 RepID=A0AAD7D210_MYCRO|nr:hypothetical protein B0H17DRAFT_1140418 [Mycena rosella]
MARAFAWGSEDVAEVSLQRGRGAASNCVHIGHTEDARREPVQTDVRDADMGDFGEWFGDAGGVVGGDGWGCTSVFEGAGRERGDAKCWNSESVARYLRHRALDHYQGNYCRINPLRDCEGLLLFPSKGRGLPLFQQSAGAGAGCIEMQTVEAQTAGAVREELMAVLEARIWIQDVYYAGAGARCV